MASYSKAHLSVFPSHGSVFLTTTIHAHISQSAMPQPSQCRISPAGPFNTLLIMGLMESCKQYLLPQDSLEGHGPSTLTNVNPAYGPM